MMAKRFVSIWFHYLKTDWLIRCKPVLKDTAFVFASPDHGRMVINASNGLAQQQGINPGMMLADARAIVPGLQFFEEDPGRFHKLLVSLAEWCIRFTPIAATDFPNGLLLDATGCTHLWGGEKQYLEDISRRLNGYGYQVKIAIADTAGAAWAMARFGEDVLIIEKERQSAALLSLPPAALRLEPAVTERLEKLGLQQISQFIRMPRTALRRRFGEQLLRRLDEMLGLIEENIQPVQPVPQYQERLPCLEPIVTATGIEIALQRLLEALCNRLKQEEKGIRSALFNAYRVDGKTEQIKIGTNRPNSNSRHLFKLFEISISTIEPALGIELFTLDAPQVEPVSPVQEKIFETAGGLNDAGLAELLDRIGGKIGAHCIHRFVPDEHHWPERSFKKAVSLLAKEQATWTISNPRPLYLLNPPEQIEVTAPIPDYPPMLFRYKGALHIIAKADGPERIEQEWWLQEGQHRDYYYVEDREGRRYWLFRSGHYDHDRSYKWFIHGFFP